jgi:DNA-binding transcriptional ArsR family regulator
MRPLPHPAAEEINLPAVLHALADPVRLDIVRRLAAAGCGLSCTATAGDAGLPKSTLSSHFRVLREAGLVRSERKGVQLCNRLRCEELERRFPGLLRAVLAAREAEAGGERPGRSAA